MPVKEDVANGQANMYVYVCICVCLCVAVCVCVCTVQVRILKITCLAVHLQKFRSEPAAAVANARTHVQNDRDGVAGGNGGGTAHHSKA